MVEMETTKTKPHVVAHVMKDKLFNPLIDEKSDVVIS